MKTKIIFFLYIYFSFNIWIQAQYNFSSPPNIYTDIPDSEKEEIINNLNEFLNVIKENNYDHFLEQENIDINRNYFKFLNNIFKNTESDTYPLQLLNLYRITGSKSYLITIAHFNNTSTPTLSGIYTLIVNKYNNKFFFGSPIGLRTKSWKTKTIDKTTFHYPDKLNAERVESFIKSNKIIAKKLGLSVKNFNVYVTNNYQEVLFLQGIDYSYINNGITNLGDIIASKFIFTVMGNENFSHDVLHTYANDIRDKVNVIAEEGLAYAWGNVYYADSLGYIPNQKDLLAILKEYIHLHPEESLLNIFIENPPIFNYNEKISPRSVISGLICDEIEQKKGTNGIIDLLQCGSGSENYFKSIDKLLSINKDNFDNKIRSLIMKN